MAVPMVPKVGDLAEVREDWQRLRWLSFPWRGTPGYDDALWPRAKSFPLRAADAKTEAQA